MRPAKVLFISKKRNDTYGISYGLFNSANFVSSFFSGSEGFESRFATAIDANEIDRIVTGYDPSHVVIEALWVTPAKLHEILSLRRHHHRLWIVRIHSKLAFLANEGMACDWLWGYQHVGRNHSNLVIAPNTPDMVGDLETTFRMRGMVEYLPNIYNPLQSPAALEVSKPENTLDVGCFGAIRPLKNVLTQAVAAIKYAEEERLKLRFHINGNRIEQKGEPVYNNIKHLFGGQRRHVLVEHNWMPHDQFVSLIKTMDIGMQVSFTESYCIVAADFIANGIGFVGSQEITFLPSGLQANPSSVEEICSAMRRTRGFYGFVLRKLAKMHLNSFNSRAKSIWSSFILETL